jgi:lipopolysaccharide transport system permease protein
MAETTEWDIVIRPRAGWFDIALVDVWRYRDLALLFAWRDIASQYKQTIFGPAWHLLQPLLTSLLFVAVFGRMAGLSTGGAPAMLFYMCGVTCWTLFADCLMRTSTTFTQNASVFGKVHFPRLTVPIAAVLALLVKFGIQLGLLVAFLLFYAITGRYAGANAAVSLVPVLIIMAAALGLGLGLIVSALTVKYRDLQVLVGFGVQLAMFATPVIFPMSSLHGTTGSLLMLNPMAPILEAFRYAMIGTGAFDSAYLWLAAATIALTLAAGVLLFARAERTFIDIV